MRFITLGPSGSNHEFVAHRYLDLHGIREHASVELALDFAQAAQAVLDGRADFLLQCAVHPATMATVARFFDGLYVIDAFVSPSQDLAIIQRRDAGQPKSLAVMRPTLDYIDSSRWERIEFVDTVADVTAGLADGTYAAGLGYAAIARTHPDRLHMTQFIGTVDDAWIVYGRTRVSDGNVVAWRDSPAALCYRQSE
ncbi:MAG: hypothetical protein JWQ73_3842 [Variovorax sp.]|nr:hypothetical protein [Variovorax sp.]